MVEYYIATPSGWIRCTPNIHDDLWRPVSDQRPLEITSRSFYSDPYDEIQERIRPSIPPVETVEVGLDKRFQYVDEAVDYVNRARNDKFVEDPYRRYDIVVDDGVYINKYNPEVSPNVAIIGKSNDPNKCQIIANDRYGLRGIFETLGSFYIEGIKLTVPKIPAESRHPEWKIKYPIHAVFVGTSIYSRVIFDAPDRTSIGSDGGPSGSFYFHECDIDNGTNLHGPNIGPYPFVVVAYNSRVNNLVYTGFDKEGEPGCEMYVVGNSSFNEGGSAGYYGNNSKGLTKARYIGSEVTPPKRSYNLGDPLVVKDDWPIPNGGISPNQRKMMFGQ